MAKPLPRLDTFRLLSREQPKLTMAEKWQRSIHIYSAPHDISIVLLEHALDRDHWRSSCTHREHYPVVHAAKYELGMPVVTNMAIEAHHAYLPKYHLEWHSEPMSI